MSITGAVLQALLKERRMTQSELAAQINLTAGSITHIVSGRRQKIDLELSKKLSAALDTSEAFWSDLHEAEANGLAKPVTFYLEGLGYSRDQRVAPGVLVDHQIRAFVRTEREEEREGDLDGILIEAFDPSRIQASSYDTVIGGYWLNENGRNRPKDVNGSLTLPSRGSREVYTREFFRMPATIHGRIAPAGSFVRGGIVVAHGPIIDPMFEGRLTVTLHNLHDEPKVIETKSPFLTIIFERLSATPMSPRKLVASRLAETKFEDELEAKEAALLRQLVELRAAKRKG
jgi:deoxycytidine triphosphate deaminase/DNA-binding Xre family transcriptional regulator